MIEFRADWVEKLSVERTNICVPYIDWIGLYQIEFCFIFSMPRIVGGNTFAATAMIGERAAEFVKQKWMKAENVQSKTEL